MVLMTGADDGDPLFLQAKEAEASVLEPYAGASRFHSHGRRVERLGPRALEVYARLCGWTLARAHARSGDRVAIAAYLGSGDAFEQAVAEFAGRYADQNERDHAALAAAAVDRGRVAAEGA
jgi:hypothetical protein